MSASIINTNCVEGLICPKCKHSGRFFIDATAQVTVEPQGVIDVSDFTWDEDSAITCPKCDHCNTVLMFHEDAIPDNKPARAQFLQDVMTTAIEGGVSYWALANNVKRGGDDGLDYLSYELCDMEEDEETRTWDRVDPAVIELGIKRLIDGKVKVRMDIIGSIAAGSAQNDAGNIDATCADCIVQAAIFNDIIFG